MQNVSTNVLSVVFCVTGCLYATVREVSSCFCKKLLEVAKYVKLHSFGDTYER